MTPENRSGQSERALAEAWERADAGYERADVEALAQSKQPGDRLLALCAARKRIDAGDSPGLYLEMASRLVADSDNNCRWQAAIVVGESIDTDPEAVWRVVACFGDSPDDDMRDVMATVLLEHLLEHDFDGYMDKVKAEIARGRLGFLDTLASCWLTAETPEAKRLKNYVRNARRGESGKGRE